MNVLIYGLTLRPIHNIRHDDDDDDWSRKDNIGMDRREWEWKGDNRRGIERIRLEREDRSGKEMLVVKGR